ncbi:MAG: uroporphyrinogen decarboxylase [Alphaproteobacteria bacterium]
MTQGANGKRLLKVLEGAVAAPPPIWLMRQAGRYLPEYRETRSRARDFLDLCDRPDLAAEVTLQPLRRFALDAAIVFADILLLPRALGQHVEFREGEGPVLEAIARPEKIASLSAEHLHGRMAPVYETLGRVKARLEPHIALLGFAGAPFTVATYMIEGRGPGAVPRARLFAYEQPEAFARLIDLLTDSTIGYLRRQIDAGADALQLFDSWAGGLPDEAFDAWCVEPARRIVAALKESHPAAPVIGFPRGAGAACERYFRKTGVAALGLDTGMDLEFARERLQNIGPVQGNLDPLALVAGGEALERAVRTRLALLGDGPYIFNLGHGIVPQTPPEHVAALCRLVKGMGEGNEPEHVRPG